MTEMVFIVDLFGVPKSNPAASQQQFRFSNKAYSDGSNSYAAKLQQPALVSYSMDISSSFGGQISSSIGEIVLTNFSRELDYLKNYIFKGYIVRLSYVKRNHPLSSATLLLEQIVERLSFEWETVTIRIADMISKFEVPLQTKKYLGNNSSVPTNDGLEGATSLKDKYKPLCFGRVNNITAINVNSTTLVDQISSEKCEIIINGFADGAYISKGVLVTDINSSPYPEAGYYNWTDLTYGGQGAFARRGMEGGAITYSVITDADPTKITVAGCVRKVLSLFGFPVYPSTQSDYDLLLLDRSNAASVGIFVSEGQTVSSVLTELSSSIGAFWGFDAQNNFRIFRLENPTLGDSIYIIDSVADFDEYGISDFSSDELAYNNKYAIVNEVIVNYDKNYTVQTPDVLAGVVPEERQSWLGQEYRQISAKFTPASKITVQTVTVNTLLVSEISATVEANRLLALYGTETTQKEFCTASLKLPVLILKTLFPGQTITLKIPRYGLDNGRSFIILSCELNFFDQTANLTLWG